MLRRRNYRDVILSDHLTMENSVKCHVNSSRYVRCSRFDGQDERRITRLHFQFRKNPDAVDQFERLVKHVLPLDVAFGDGEHVVLLQLGRNGVHTHRDVADGVLNFVLSWDILPRRKEDPLVHLTIFGEKDVQREHRREVEDVDVVLDGHLTHKRE